jgi:hypothetical protein
MVKRTDDLGSALGAGAELGEEQHVTRGRQE